MKIRTAIQIVVLAAAGAALWVLQRPKGTDIHGHGAADAEKAVYQCSMHPQIVSDKPGLCPICNMRLDKVETKKEDHDQVHDHEKSGEARGIPGHAGFELSAERQQLIGVKTAETLVQELVAVIPASGRAGKGGRDVAAQVFEFEAGPVRAGLPFEAESERNPGRVFRGRLAGKGDRPDPATRTLAVWGRLDRGAAPLQPGEMVKLRIHAPLGRALAVPVDAVLDTGRHRLAFVRTGEGRFEPRSLRLGREGNGLVEVLGGLKAGERVVTGANFLIDSESRFRAAAEEYGGHIH